MHTLAERDHRQLSAPRPCSPPERRVSVAQNRGPTPVEAIHKPSLSRATTVDAPEALRGLCSGQQSYVIHAKTGFRLMDQLVDGLYRWPPTPSSCSSSRRSRIPFLLAASSSAPRSYFSVPLVPSSLSYSCSSTSFAPGTPVYINQHALRHTTQGIVAAADAAAARRSSFRCPRRRCLNLAQLTRLKRLISPRRAGEAGSTGSCWSRRRRASGRSPSARASTSS